MLLMIGTIRPAMDPLEAARASIASMVEAGSEEAGRPEYSYIQTNGGEIGWRSTNSQVRSPS